MKPSSSHRGAEFFLQTENPGPFSEELQIPGLPERHDVIGLTKIGRHDPGVGRHPHTHQGAAQGGEKLPGVS